MNHGTNQDPKRYTGPKENPLQTPTQLVIYCKQRKIAEIQRKTKAGIKNPDYEKEQQTLKNKLWTKTKPTIEQKEERKLQKLIDRTKMQYLTIMKKYNHNIKKLAKLKQQKK